MASGPDTSCFFIFQVVFVSPFEHHSNLLPWKEIGAEVSGTPSVGHSFQSCSSVLYSLLSRTPFPPPSFLYSLLSLTVLWNILQMVEGWLGGLGMKLTVCSSCSSLGCMDCTGLEWAGWYQWSGTETEGTCSSTLCATVHTFLSYSLHSRFSALWMWPSNTHTHTHTHTSTILAVVVSWLVHWAQLPTSQEC